MPKISKRYSYIDVLEIGEESMEFVEFVEFIELKCKLNEPNKLNKPG